ncbi:hypothetical protein EJB05_43864, partial [Eragrostis curvula]
MKLSACTVLSLLFLLLPSCRVDDRLIQGKPFSPGDDVIVSDAGAFALGFFSPSNSFTPARLYLGIWYNGIPERTVVWVANRETPIIVTGRGAGSSAPTLAVTNTSNLVLYDAGGRVVWAANNVADAATNSSSASGAAATLTNDGNLVLRSPTGTVLWQSFDHPTDTFLPEMKLRVNNGHRFGDRLVSWKSPGDPAPGGLQHVWFEDSSHPACSRPLLFGGMSRLQLARTTARDKLVTDDVVPCRKPNIILWNGSRPLWRSGVWTGYRVTTEYVADIVYFAVVDVEDDAYVSFRLSNGTSRKRYVMSYAGKLELQSWNNASLRWDVLGTMPRTECSHYGYCGPFGYCDHTDGGEVVPMCKCLDGGRGCRRKEALRCGTGGGDGFLPLPDMKAPDRFVRVANHGFDECAAECRRNCSCVAYAHASLRSSHMGDSTRCLLRMGDLIDTEKIGAKAEGSETLYLRLAGLPTGKLYRAVSS